MSTDLRRPVFPDKMALVNPVNETGIIMNFVREVEVTLETKPGSDIATHKIKCDYKSAVFLSRPYIRLREGDLEPGVKAIIINDGERIFQDKPVDQLLVQDLKDPILDQLFEWPKQKLMLFHGIRYTAEGSFEKRIHGYFAPNATGLEIWLKDAARYELGYVAALYEVELGRSVRFD